MSVKESALAIRAQAGDLEAFGELVELFSGQARRVARAVLGDPDDGDDAAQDAFLSALRHLKRYDPSRPFGPWLMRIVADAAADHRRKWKSGLPRSCRSPRLVAVRVRTSRPTAGRSWRCSRTSLPGFRVFVARVMAEIRALDVRRFRSDWWEVLGAWARPGLAAAALVALTMGLTISSQGGCRGNHGRRRTPGIDRGIRIDRDSQPAGRGVPIGDISRALTEGHR